MTTSRRLSFIVSHILSVASLCIIVACSAQMMQNWCVRTTDGEGITCNTTCSTNPPVLPPFPETLSLYVPDCGGPNETTTPIVTSTEPTTSTVTSTEPTTSTVTGTEPTTSTVTGTEPTTSTVTGTEPTTLTVTGTEPTTSTVTGTEPTTSTVTGTEPTTSTVTGTEPTTSTVTGTEPTTLTVTGTKPTTTTVTGTEPSTSTVTGTEPTTSTVTGTEPTTSTVTGTEPTTIIVTGTETVTQTVTGTETTPSLTTTGTSMTSTEATGTPLTGTETTGTPVTGTTLGTIGTPVTGTGTTEMPGPPEYLQCKMAATYIGVVLGVSYVVVLFLIYVHLLKTENKVYPDETVTPTSSRPQTPQAFNECTSMQPPETTKNPGKKEKYLDPPWLYVVIVIILSTVIAMPGIIVSVIFRSFCATLGVICFFFIIFIISLVCSYCFLKRKQAQQQADEQDKAQTLPPAQGLKEERPTSPTPSSSGRIISTPHGADPTAGLGEQDDFRERKISAGSRAGDTTVLISGGMETGRRKVGKKKRMKRGSRQSIELGPLVGPRRASYAQIENERV